MTHNREFSPLTTKPKAHKIAAFDIEGVGGTDGFICGTLVDEQRKVYTRNREQFIDLLLNSRYEGYRLYAHYLTYDFGVILPYLRKEYVATLLRGKVFKVSCPLYGHHTVTLCDSLGMLANLPLAAVGRAIGLPKYDTPPSLLPPGATAQEWYCEAHGKLWCEKCYNIRDAEIVRKAMCILQDTLLSLGSDLHNTLASTAMVLFRRCFLQDTYLHPLPYRNEFARRAYYGGRVEPYVLGEWDDLDYYDFHSLYPAVMLQEEYPDPNYLRGVCENDDPSYIYNYEGISEVEVEAPPMHIPILPFRASGKLYFPIGVMRGVWTHAELRYALAHGYKLRQVYATLYSTKTCNPFRQYVQTLWNLRREAKQKRNATELVYKIMLNSLYGKFGQGASSQLERLIPADDFDDGDDLTGYLAMQILDRLYLREPVYIPEEPSYVIVPWAAYITSYARIRLHQAMEKADYAVYYTDTDSLFTTQNMPVSDDIGHLGEKGKDLRVEFFAPKMYRYITRDGKIQLTCKGVPEEYRAAYLSNKEVEFRKAVGIREAAVRHLTPSEWVITKRIMRYTDPKREYYRKLGMREGCYLSKPFAVDRLPLSSVPAL